jgi:hypothetical protein
MSTATMTPIQVLHAADDRAARLSGLPGFRQAAIARAAAVMEYEAVTGQRVEEPQRGLWIRQAVIEREAVEKEALSIIDHYGSVRTSPEFRPAEFAALEALSARGVLLARDRSHRGYVTFIRAAPAGTTT